MENTQTPPTFTPMEPVLNLNKQTQFLPQAFGVSQQRYTELAKLVDGILKGEQPQLGAQDTTSQGMKINLELPEVMEFLQANAANIHELVLLVFFFGNALGQIQAHMVQAKEMLNVFGKIPKAEA